MARAVCEICGTYAGTPHKANCHFAKKGRTVKAAKKKEPRIGGANDVARQMNQMVESMETYTKHRIECFLCCTHDSARDVTEQRFARELYAAGWRIVDSDKYQTIGAACPECAATPDYKR